MRKVTGTLAVLVAMLVPLALTPTVNAAGEKVTANTKLTPKNGTLYKKKRVPSRLFISASVNAPASSTKVIPTKRIKLTFPRGMSLNPNQKICRDNKLNKNSALGNPKQVVNSCRGAVIGTGTAMIYLAQNKAAPLRDAVLVAFNAGKTRKGEPRLKIYGYSQSTTVGILMTSVLKGRVLNLHIPVLSFDSSVGTFRLGIPGSRLKRPELDIDVKGLAPNYMLASCPVSPMVTKAVFLMGTRDPSTGQATSPTTTVNSPATRKNCVGRNYNPRLGKINIKGPNAVWKGRRALYRVTVRNTGNVRVNRVIVRTNRGGKVNLGNIARNRKKVAKLRVRINGRKGKRIGVKFMIRSNNAKAINRWKMVRVR